MPPHPNARTNPFSRQLLVQRIQEGWTVRAAAGAVGVSRGTAYKWLKRYREEGPQGLQDRRSTPRSIPHRTSAQLVRRVEELRRRFLTGRRIAEQLGMARSTVSAVLRRLGLGRLRALRPKEPVLRYEWPKPGDLVHVDIKPLGRFDRPGHRIHGRGKTPRSKGAGWDFVHVCVDDYSRVAYTEVLEAQTGEACAAFFQRALRWFAQRGVRIRRVMTDNAKAYTVGHAWREVLRRHRIRRHITTRPYRPQTNGKAERFIKTLLHEWAYGRCYRNARQRTKALRPYLRHYNQARPHGSLGERPPVSRLRARCKQPA